MGSHLVLLINVRCFCPLHLGQYALPLSLVPIYFNWSSIYFNWSTFNIPISTFNIPTFCHYHLLQTLDSLEQHALSFGWDLTFQFRAEAVEPNLWWEKIEQSSVLQRICTRGQSSHCSTRSPTRDSLLVASWAAVKEAFRHIMMSSTTPEFEHLW